MSSRSQNFWPFSVELYARDGVADACLELQSRFGVDVNLLLFCYWFADQYGELDDELLEQLCIFSTLWRQQVVQPLRDVRNWMKDNSPVLEATEDSQYSRLRERIKFDELAAEKYQQESMQRLADSALKARVRTDSVSTTLSNAQRMLMKMSIDADDSLRSSLSIISDALKH